MMDDTLLSQLILKDYLNDLSDIIISLENCPFNFNDRLQLKIDKIWFPSGHDYCLVTNHLSSLNDNTQKTIKSVIKRSIMNQDILSKLSTIELEKEFINEVDQLLLNNNKQQIRYGQFYFVSSKIPSLNELNGSAKEFEFQFRTTIENVLLPKIAYEIIPDNCPNEIQMSESWNTFSVLLSDPEICISSDNDDSESFVNLNYELLDRNLISIYSSSETLSIQYQDNLQYAWIYYLDESNDIDYQQIINKILDNYIQNNPRFDFDKISLLLMEYNGVPSSYQFIIGPDNDILVLFNLLYEHGKFDDFITDAYYLNDEHNAMKLTLKSDFDNSLFIGSNGISSSLGPVFDPDDRYHSSLKKAIDKIFRIVGFQSDEIISFIGIWDKRKTSKIVHELQTEGVI